MFVIQHKLHCLYFKGSSTSRWNHRDPLWTTAVGNARLYRTKACAKRYGLRGEFNPALHEIVSVRVKR